MNTSLILKRFRQVESSLSNKALLQVICDGNSLFLQTGERVVQRSRLMVRLGSGLGILAGLTLASFSPWGWAVIAISLLVFLFVPRFITSRRLLKIDTVGEQLILLQNTGAEVSSLSLANLCGLHGVYETRGWDPCSVVYARMQDGSQAPILLLMGGSEKLAEEACGLLGSLLDCPVTYTGPFGAIRSCYAPTEVRG